MSTSTTPRPLLDVVGLRVAYGGVVAVSDVDVHIAEGTVFGLIGPNGAGKTSMVDALTGYTRPAAGTITFGGRDISRLRPYRRARLGLARTFQSVELFDDLTVDENLLVASEHVSVGSALRDLFLPHRPPDRAGVDWAIGVCGLEDVVDRYPSEISLGKRKLVGVGRSLARQPRLVLLDEPAAGLDTDESLELGRRLRTLPEAHGVTVFLIDHDMGLVLSVCDHLMVLDFGRQIASGSPAEIREDPRVIEAYLELDMPQATNPNDSGHALVLEDLCAGYQQIAVVRDLRLEVRPGEVVALLGPNGAGKTTTLETIAGLNRPISGQVKLSGEDVGGVAAHTLARRGLALVPEGRALFPGLTVREHLRLAGGRTGPQEGELLEMLPELEKCLQRKAGLLSGGEQQMLAIGRALVTRPRLLLVDEMSLGLAPVIVERLLPILRRVADDFGTSVLFVEQHVALALEISDRAYVLSHGRIALEGAAAELRERRELLAASYLGEAAAA